MERIFYGSTLAPTLFEENIPFDETRPYTVSVKKFRTEEFTIPHYAPTLEILIVGDVTGEIHVEGTGFHDVARRVFVIPPYFVHSMRIDPGAGRLLVLKCSMEHIGHFVRLESFFAADGVDFLRTPMVLSACFEAVDAAMNRLIAEDAFLYRRMQALLAVFDAMTEEASRAVTAPAVKPDAALKTLIDWTRTNLSAHLTLDDAAAVMGYSKYHFCRWFHENANMTYLAYLTHVRMIHAARLLLGGTPVADVGAACGYSNISHFIRLFHRQYHCTPGQYLSRFRDS